MNRGKTVVLVFLMVVMSGGMVSAGPTCQTCQSFVKAVPDHSAYWEAKLGKAALTEGPFVEVSIPLDSDAMKMVAALAAYAGGTLTVEKDSSRLITHLSHRAAKSLLAKGVALDFVTLGNLRFSSKAVPENDDCEQALPAEPNVTYTGSTAEAADADVWYRFTPSETGDYTLSLTNSDFDTWLFVYDQCGGEEIGFDDDGGQGATSELVLPLSAGQTYYIRISGFSGATGDYVFVITRKYTLPGETCSSAIPIELNSLQTGTIDDSIPEAWYVFTAQKDGYVLVSTEGSEFDTALEVYDQCRGTLLKGDDDSGDNMTALLGLPVVAGKSYYIKVASYWWEEGLYRLQVTPYVPLMGEFREVAIPIQTNTRDTGNTENMLEGVAWYRYVPQSSGPVVMSLLGSEYDTVLVVTDEKGGLLLGYNDETNTPQSRLSMDVVAGNTYYILVQGYWGEVGAYRLEVLSVLRPPHDAVASPLEIQAQIPIKGSTDGATTTLAESMCGYYDSRDVWYRYIPSSSGFVKITVDANDFDPTLTIFDEQQGVELLCCDDADYSCTFNARLYSQMVAGTAYLIRVAGSFTTTGNFTLQVTSFADQLPKAAKIPKPTDKGTIKKTNTVLSWDRWRPVVVKDPLTQAVKSTKPLSSPLMSLYGYDGRKEEYQITDSEVRALGDATVVLIDRGDLQLDADSHTYTLSGPTLMEWSENSLCEDEPFVDQPSIGFCSGFLVSPDIVVTAGHCTGCDDDLEEMAVVFGFVMVDANTARLTVSADDVYLCQEVLANQNGDPDWGLIRLDREVKNHYPLSLRRSGRVAEGESLTIIGHPLGLPRKYDRGGAVRDNWVRNHFGANLDAYGGNSGSAVLNQKSSEVEGILVWGLEDFMSDYEQDCLRSTTCPDTGCPGFERVTRSFLFADLVPCYDVLMGTQPDGLVLLKAGCPAPECKVDGLLPGQTYYWQVRSRNAGGNTMGPIWSFTVAP